MASVPTPALRFGGVFHATPESPKGGIRISLPVDRRSALAESSYGGDEPSVRFLALFVLPPVLLNMVQRGGVDHRDALTTQSTRIAVRIDQL